MILSHSAAVTSVHQIFGRDFTRADFTSGWLVTGGPASGKTVCGLSRLLHAAFLTERSWGGLVLDPSGRTVELLHGFVQAYARQGDLRCLRTERDPAAGDQPPVRFNPLGDERVSANMLAHALVLDNRANGQIFFQLSACLSISRAITLCRMARAAALQVGGDEILASLPPVPTIPLILSLLTSRERYEAFLQSCRILVHKEFAQEPGGLVAGPLLGNPRDGSPAARTHEQHVLGECLAHFRARYWALPVETLGGIQGTVTTALEPFLSPEIARVFCADSTFSFDDLERGTIVCLDVAPTYGAAEQMLAALLKVHFLTHFLRRFDHSPTVRATENLLLAVFDGAASYLRHRDDLPFNFAREAKVGFVVCERSVETFEPAMKSFIQAHFNQRMMFAPAGWEASDFAILSARQRHERPMRPGDCLVLEASTQHARRVAWQPVLPDGTSTPCARRDDVPAWRSFPGRLLAAWQAGVARWRQD